MKLICEGLDLAEAVAAVSRVTNTRTVNPILEGIKLVAADGTLTLSATDLEIYIRKTIRADVKQPGTVIVPGKLFSEYIRTLDKNQISLTVEGDTILINHGDNVCNFQTMMVAEYPDIISLSSKPHFSIKSEHLRELIAKTTVSASTDDSRPILKGVLCEIDKTSLTGVALDGFRLSRITKPIVNNSGSIKIVIPARALDEVKKIVGDDSGEINVIIENKFFQIEINKTTFASRLIEGEFINYRQIIPASYESSVVLEKSVFEEAVERAGLLVRSDKINLVTLKIADKQVSITSNNEIGKIAEKVPAALKGKDMTIAFNAKYLFDALRNTSNEFIKLCFNNELAPCTISGAKDDSDFLFLILPVRMN